MTAAYVPSPIRRKRRTKAEMEAIRSALYEILEEGEPMTVRQVFYAATTRGVVEKTEAEYKGTVCRLLTKMRREGEIPYSWIADNTRWMRKPTTYSSAEQYLKSTAELYRRALWDDSPVCVEIWLEKEALAGVLVDVTDEWDVPLMVTRGNASLSFTWSAAQAIKHRSRGGQRTCIYHFGDSDTWGKGIDTQIVRDGAKHGAEFEFARAAVTEAQIEEWNLPTRPDKADGRPVVELDAIPADRLRQLARDCIERHVDPYQLNVLLTAEEEERRLLLEMAATFNGGSS
jgi:hypothetical protein